MKLQRTPPQCQVGGILSLVPSAESRSCLSRCALSARVLLWHLFQQTSPLVIDTIRGYRWALPSISFSEESPQEYGSPMPQVQGIVSYSHNCVNIATRRNVVQLRRHTAASTAVHLFSSGLVGHGIGARPSLYLYLYKLIVVTSDIYLPAKLSKLTYIFTLIIISIYVYKYIYNNIYVYAVTAMYIICTYTCRQNANLVRLY